MEEIEEITNLISTLGWYQKYSRLPEADIVQAEARLGVKLPPSLRLFYRELGGHPLFKNQMVYCFDLIPLPDLKFAEEGNAEPSVMLFTEGMGNQAVWECMRRSQFDQPNPQTEFWVVDYLQEEHPLKEGLLNVVMTNILSSFRQRAKISGMNLLPLLQASSLLALPMLDDLLGTTCFGNQDVFVTVQAQKNFATFETRSIEKLKSVLSELKIGQCHELTLFVDEVEDVDMTDVIWLKESVSHEAALALWQDSQKVSFDELRSAVQKAEAIQKLF